MRNFRRFNKSSLLRSVAIAVAGSTLSCCNNNYDIRASVAARLPLSLQDYFPSTCPVQNDFCPQLLHFPNISGLFPFNSYRVGPVPLPYITKEYSGAVHDGSKPCGFFGRDSIANAAAKVGPAVVKIVVPLDTTVERGIGSGTIINKDGTILTCAHVVDGSLEGKVEVTLQDGRTFVAEVIHADKHSDIAIIKINSETPLPEAKLGNSSRLRPGDWVIAMGCSKSLQNTVTAGIVSFVDRRSGDMGLKGIHRDFVQTDCATNSGSSGGPLVNIDGEVVGVNALKLGAADGLGFAISADLVSKVIEQFKKNGRVIRPRLGLKMLDLNEMIIAQLKKIDASFPNVDKGILVHTVFPRSPADRAGFRPGDVIVEFDGKPVESIKEIMEIVGDKAGVEMKVIIIRRNDISVTLVLIPEPNLEI